MDFAQSKIDSCLFTRKRANNTTYIITYVDDILIVGKDEVIEEIIANLNNKYKLKNLGEISNNLSMNIRKVNKRYFINQTSKIDELIIKFNLQDAKPHSTPMETNYTRLNDEDNILSNNILYRQATGNLLYIATVSRPDICAAVNILSRRNEKPRIKDWNAAKRVIRYLKYTKDCNLVLDGEKEPKLELYADKNWCGDIVSRR